MSTHKVTFIIEAWGHGESVTDAKGGVFSRFGLIRFTDDCPPTYHNATARQAKHAEENNYRVIGICTAPAEEREPESAPQVDGDRVTYSVPTECLRWLNRFFERQGYVAMENDDGEFEVLTKDEADALYAANFEFEIAELAAQEEEGE